MKIDIVAIERVSKNKAAPRNVHASGEFGKKYPKSGFVFVMYACLPRM
jgi:hypothetical protein